MKNILPAVFAFAACFALSACAAADAPHSFQDYRKLVESAGSGPACEKSHAAALACLNRQIGIAEKALSHFYRESAERLTDSERGQLDQFQAQWRRDRSKYCAQAMLTVYGGTAMGDMAGSCVLRWTMQRAEELDSLSSLLTLGKDSFSRPSAPVLAPLPEQH